MNMNTRHPNQMTSPWFPTSKSREELLAERDILGPIISGNYLPYIARLIDVEVDAPNERYRQVVIPASMEEVHQYWRKMHTFQVDGSEQDSESREEFARKVAAELWQESWLAGVPATEIISCAACQEERPAHGSNRYDDLLLCNRCVESVEVFMAKGELLSVESWVQEQAQRNRLRLAIREAEHKGQGYILLPDGRWLEIIPLYEFIRHSEYGNEGENKRFWPYPDMRPSMYHGYVRSNWQPGQYFNAPDEEIIFTDSNKLLHFLETGELPPRASRSPRSRPKQKR
jgi:hypothetical protein